MINSRISEEAVEMEHELIELQKHISTQGILVQDLMTGVCRELEDWKQCGDNDDETLQDFQSCELQDPLHNEVDDNERFFEKIDILLAEHRVDEALEVLDAEEKNSLELKSSGDISSTEASSFKAGFLRRKDMLEDQLVEICEQPSISIAELKKALSGLTRLGKGPLAHQLLLKFYGSRIQKSIECFLPSCSVCPRTYPATLSKLVFSVISHTTKESGLIFGDNPVYTNRLVQWAEWEIEFFVRLVKEKAPLSEKVSALRAASILVESSLNYSLALESLGLNLSKLVLVLLRPFVEEVLELNFRRAKKAVIDLVEHEDCMPFSPRYASQLAAFSPSSDNMLVGSGIRFMCIVEVS